MAAFTGNTEVVKTTAINMKDRIASQVAEDGSLPEELARTRSYMYSHFALRGINYAHEIAANKKYGEMIDNPTMQLRFPV